MYQHYFSKVGQVTAFLVAMVFVEESFARNTLSTMDDATTAQRTVIRNVTVIQTGAKKVSTSVADVWLENGMIQAVLRPGSTAPKSTSSDVKQIDGSGRFLLPGLIDSHVHLANVAGMTGAQKKKNPQALSAYWQQLPRSYLYYGFTSLVDLNAYHPNQIKSFSLSPVAPRLWHCGPQVSVYEDFTFAVEGLSEAEIEIRHRIIGTTPRWQDHTELFDVIGYQRQTEIEAWIRSSGQPWLPWVAIDDKPYLFRPFLPNLIKTVSSTGFDANAEISLRKLLIPS